MTLRFGLDGTNEWRTLAEVARHMNCSREYCRQVVQRALRKLRKTVSRVVWWNRHAETPTGEDR